MSWGPTDTLTYVDGDGTAIDGEANTIRIEDGATGPIHADGQLVVNSQRLTPRWAHMTRSHRGAAEYRLKGMRE